MMDKLKTTVKTIHLKTDQGSVNINAYCVGPFAVHHSPRSLKWTVTHIATGLALVQHLSKKIIALEFVERVLALPIAWDRITTDVYLDTYHEYMSDESYEALHKLYSEYQGR